MRSLNDSTAIAQHIHTITRSSTEKHPIDPTHKSRKRQTKKSRSFIWCMNENVRRVNNNTTKQKKARKKLYKIRRNQNKKKDKKSISIEKERLNVIVCACVAHSRWCTSSLSFTSCILISGAFSVLYDYFVLCTRCFCFFYFYLFLTRLRMHRDNC